ncbi:MAG: hypothetical protein ACYC1M_13730 [Armatimonadota bacterium]
MKRYLIAAVLMCASITSFAQQPQPEPPEGGPSPEVAAPPVNDGTPIATVLADWAKKYDKTLVVEPGLTNRVKIDPAAKSFEQGLELTLTPLKTIKWRKVYLRAKMKQPKPERLAAMVRSLEAMEATGMIIQDPAGNKISSFAKAVEVPQNYASGLEKMNPSFNTVAVYVVYDSKPAWASANGVELFDLTADPSSIPAGAINAQSLQAIQQKLLAAIMSMDPDERAAAMRGMMAMSNNMDSRTRVQMMIEGIKAMNSMTPEERDGMMKRTMEDLQTMKDMGVQLPGMPSNPQPPPPGK